MGSVQLWTLVFVVLSFGLYIGIAIWSRVSATSGFYVAGQGVTSVFNGVATAADWMSAAPFISVAGQCARCRVFWQYREAMRYGRAPKLVLWSSGLLLTLWLLFQLVVTVFDGTEITVDLENREAAAQTTLGDLNCRKELKAAFPFLTFTCRSTREASE